MSLPPYNKDFYIIDLILIELEEDWRDVVPNINHVFVPSLICETKFLDFSVQTITKKIKIMDPVFKMIVFADSLPTPSITPVDQTITQLHCLFDIPIHQKASPL